MPEETPRTCANHPSPLAVSISVHSTLMATTQWMLLPEFEIKASVVVVSFGLNWVTKSHSSRAPRRCTCASPWFPPLRLIRRLPSEQAPLPVTRRHLITLNICRRGPKVRFYRPAPNIDDIDRRTAGLGHER